MGSNPVESPEFFRFIRQLLLKLSMQVRGSYLHLISNTALHITLLWYYFSPTIKKMFSLSLSTGTTPDVLKKTSEADFEQFKNFRPIYFELKK